MPLLLLQSLIVLLAIFCMARIFLSRRFGPASWLLGTFLGLSAATFGLGILATNAGERSQDWAFRAAISAMLTAAPLGLIFTWSVNRTDYGRVLAEKRKALVGVFGVIPLLLAFLWLQKIDVEGISTSTGYVALGPGGYLASLYLIVISVMTLSTLEQTIRGVEERVRWEMKFLVLGLASVYAAIVYIASKALLYSFRHALVPKDSFLIFTVILPVSCILIFAASRRNYGHVVIPVSHSFVYGSITFLSVGAYLIVSAVFARWVSSWGELGVQTQAVVFLLAIIALVAILLWTSFRHRVRNYIRRNLLAGKYDYRYFWMQATEKVRSVDGPEKSALALATIIQSALGAIDVSIWLRNQDNDRLKVAGALGFVVDFTEKEMKGILEEFVQIADPVGMQEVEKMPDNAAIRSFMQRTKAALLVPLCSSARLVGLLAVGSDRGGRTYNWEAREFLRVLANHAASEFHKCELLSALVATKETEAFKSFSIFLLHDLKNFASTLSLIAKNAGRHQNNPDFQRDAFQSIFDTAEKMKRLCNNLRLFSSNLSANKKEHDLNQIVHAAAGSINSGFSNHLHLDLADLPPICVDSDELVRVIQNLLINAQQAISAAGSIKVKTSHTDGVVELTVADDGIGMTKEFLEKELFLPFHTTKSDGLGIGLFQCKKIIEAHGGNISITSEQGKETIVHISFPVSGKSQTFAPDPAVGLIGLTQ
jgi:putative PEP-CTERM system histidine kinase